MLIINKPFKVPFWRVFPALQPITTQFVEWLRNLPPGDWSVDLQDVCHIRIQIYTVIQNITLVIIADIGPPLGLNPIQ